MAEATATQLDAYNNFIKNPSPQNAFDFVVSCHKYISITASKWHQTDLSRKDKIKEIITEMYLILLEDFSSGKAVSCQSAFAYLNSKLKSMINPPKKYYFSSLNDVSPTLLSVNEQFTFEKVNLIKEIVRIIRKSVLEDSFNNNGMVPFLFIHIYPKIHWISELLAEKENIPVESRYEADAKRLKRFNNQLRKRFNSVTNGDWREILNWNQTERRHLAWKIISISPEEVGLDAAEDLTLIDKWRESFNIKSHQNLKNLIVAQNVYDSMCKCLPRDNLIAAEESEFWGTTPDIISQLIGDYFDNTSIVKENEEEFKALESCSLSAENDKEFMEAAQELNKWFGKLLSERNKLMAENKLNW